ncbi:uncharacterized protein TRAVEDRAFT_48570 [Trametes versicolor FP-101664 SS1]|uniref:uncharacterized protein n=1 Tax=Trametes versicolor (strain FP-101664) TaxID=717944 RepID=UPI0004621756|nr:uncharacterized protein TRAVEDRAFT_48570 [Trametes versicolor FP-101664 SS1]EIW57531.1 hypothetical protein TRAVEDRAFT_48570 [Trametes versicolor FP-101664 SS1]
MHARTRSTLEERNVNDVFAAPPPSPVAIPDDGHGDEDGDPRGLRDEDEVPRVPRHAED